MGTNPEPAWQPLAIEAGAPLPRRRPVRFEAEQRVRVTERSTPRGDEVHDGVVTSICPAWANDDGPQPPIAYVRLDESYISAWTDQPITARVIILTDDLTAGLYDHMTIQHIGGDTREAASAHELEEACTHEESYLGACVACGAVREHEDGYSVPLPVGCMGRGWYHDGSEDAEAMRQRRPRRSCPSCSAGSRNS